jgi:hypothetical protein
MPPVSRKHSRPLGSHNKKTLAALAATTIADSAGAAPAAATAAAPIGAVAAATTAAAPIEATATIVAAMVSIGAADLGIAAACNNPISVTLFRQSLVMQK